jgi:hypothetical protein
VIASVWGAKISPFGVGRFLGQKQALKIIKKMVKARTKDP